MVDTLLLVLAFVCSILSLPLLFVAAWGLAGGDGEPPNLVTGLLGLAVGLASLASVGAASRGLSIGPTRLTVVVMLAPMALALLGMATAGPGALRGNPAADVTADDVRAMGLDPDEYGFGRADRFRDGLFSAAFWVLPVLGPLLVLAAMAG